MSPLMQSRLPMLRVEGEDTAVLERLLPPMRQAAQGAIRAGRRAINDGTAVMLRMEVRSDAWYRVELAIHPSLLMPESNRRTDAAGIDASIRDEERARTLVMVRVLQEVVEARAVARASLSDMDAIVHGDEFILDALALEETRGSVRDGPTIIASVHSATPLGTGCLFVNGWGTTEPAVDILHRHAGPGVVRILTGPSSGMSGTPWRTIRVEAHGHSVQIDRPDAVSRMRMIRDVEERRSARRGDGA